MKGRSYPEVNATGSKKRRGACYLKTVGKGSKLARCRTGEERGRKKKKSCPCQSGCWSKKKKKEKKKRGKSVVALGDESTRGSALKREKARETGVIALTGSARKE